jgi:hypothetical protein
MLDYSTQSLVVLQYFSPIKVIQVNMGEIMANLNSIPAVSD